MKQLLIMTLVAIGFFACADGASEILDASVPDAGADASVCECDADSHEHDYDTGLFGCNCEDQLPDEFGYSVGCEWVGTNQRVARFNLRPGITQIEICYSHSPGFDDGVLGQPFCWRGFGWWTEGTTDGWIFCAEEVTSVKVFY